jgi:hypothetical protein
MSYPLRDGRANRITLIITSLKGFEPEWSPPNKRTLNLWDCDLIRLYHVKRVSIGWGVAEYRWVAMTILLFQRSP